ncbi:MAG: hypothetical protein E7813_07160 [Bradyrhizobium sp.]|uniref:hypothetical protein n=1 Tax=Bradyrhizobium sp. TaxID=376 RepID=UPI0011FED2E4|nr:hypothetical protein [Bradyrhizobium sp.]THD70788.1 MAG: hypothetical protein E7813_07160 [Bradyrhizobium sp.]
MQPERALPKRRRQILDDETGGTPRFEAGEDIWAQTNGAHGDGRNEDAWVGNFIARLAGLVRKISGKN